MVSLISEHGMHPWWVYVLFHLAALAASCWVDARHRRLWLLEEVALLQQQAASAAKKAA
jgi:hypothetical protein